MDRAALNHARIELDLTEGILIADDVLLQDAEQGLGLLRAQIDSLEVVDLDLRFCLLMKSAEGEEEIPHADADLHAVGIAFAVGIGIDKFDVGLSRVRHKAVSLASQAVGKKAGGRERDTPIWINRCAERWERRTRAQAQLAPADCSASSCYSLVGLAPGKRLFRNLI